MNLEAVMANAKIIAYELHPADGTVVTHCAVRALPGAMFLGVREDKPRCRVSFWREETLVKYAREGVLHDLRALESFQGGNT